MYGYVYMTKNLVNNKIYIGQHKSDKFDPNYLGSGKLIKRSIEKYGKENFSVHLICECFSRSELNHMERQLIKYHKSNDTNIGYNISKGGDGGNVYACLSDEEKRIIREKSRKGNSGRILINDGEHQKRVKPEELQDYLDLGYVKGYLHTLERDRVRSESKKRFYRENPDFRNSSMFEKGSSGFTGKHTEETKEKIRQKLIGTKQSEETRKLKSQLLKERYARGWQSPMKGKEPYNKGERGVWMWVTDGTNNIRLKITDNIPEGYHKGRTIKRITGKKDINELSKEEFENLQEIF